MLNLRHRLYIKRICNSVAFNIEIASYTTFKVGGKAWALCNINSMDTLKRLVIYIYKNHIPYIVLGNGSNVLISDKGYEGIIIRLQGEFKKIKRNNSSHKYILLNVGAGVNISHILAYCIKENIGGLEFLSGIPGTIGGATIMNAGAFGKTLGNKIEAITCIDNNGKLIKINKSQLHFSYRKTNINSNFIITKVCLKLKPEDGDIVKEKVISYHQIRSKSQPLNYPNAGCIFKNPQGDYAGRLIETVGLKGKSVGGAMVSSKHANFIINIGNSKAEDILNLMKIITEKVKQEKNIKLEPEIKLIGFG